MWIISAVLSESEGLSLVMGHNEEKVAVAEVKDYQSMKYC